MRRNRLPRKVCTGCGGWFYGYADACARCRNEQAPDSSALVDVIRGRRVLIGDKVFDSDGNEIGVKNVRILRYGELPDGF